MILKRAWIRIKRPFDRPKILILNAVMSGGGSFVDVRYWLSRPDKIKRGSRPALIAKDGRKLGLAYLPKFGYMQPKNGKQSAAGLMLFYNKDGAVRPGDAAALHWDSLVSETFTVK